MRTKSPTSFGLLGLFALLTACTANAPVEAAPEEEPQVEVVEEATARVLPEVRYYLIADA